jgi:hypothetical protein
MPPKPIIYCETNWIVSLTFQHHHKHKEATELLAQANIGQFELRLPVTALIEAPRPINDEANTFTSTWNAFRGSIQDAVTNGRNEFDSIFRTIVGTQKEEKDALKKLPAAYIADQKKRNIIQTLEQHPHVKVLNNQNDAIPMFTTIRHQVDLRGTDTVDLFILAHVLADRAKEVSTRPAILLSLDEKAFDPNKKKVNEQFYKAHHLAWCSSFNFNHAQRRWGEWFDGSTPVDASSPDQLIKEFTDCIYNAAIRAEQFELLFHKEAHVFDNGGYLVKSRDLIRKLKTRPLHDKPIVRDGSSEVMTRKIIEYSPNAGNGASESHKFVLDLWNDGTRYWIMSLSSQG